MSTQPPPAADAPDTVRALQGSAGDLIGLISYWSLRADAGQLLEARDHLRAALDVLAPVEETP